MDRIVKKVIDNYDFAQRATKEVEAKGLEIQQFIIDKEKESKLMDTPLKKQTFEQKTAQEYNKLLINYKNIKDLFPFKQYAKFIGIDLDLDLIKTE